MIPRDAGGSAGPWWLLLAMAAGVTHLAPLSRPFSWGGWSRWALAEPLSPTGWVSRTVSQGHESSGRSGQLTPRLESASPRFQCILPVKASPQASPRIRRRGNTSRSLLGGTTWGTGTGEVAGGCPGRQRAQHPPMADGDGGSLARPFGTPTESGPQSGVSRTTGAVSLVF